MAGRLRIRGNQPIQTVPGQDTRPTMARVREAVFNIWQFAIPGCRWLDICAGTGSMGAEALSRGAVCVVGIEQAGKACAAIEQNWRKVAQPHQRIQIIRADALQALKQLTGQQFDRIYFDPPYESDLYLSVLAAIAAHRLLATDGVLAVEHRKYKTVPAAIAGLAAEKTRCYGSTALTFYRRADDA